MQIDLANTLVHKAYFVYHALFIIPIARKLGLPSFGGAGGGFWRGFRGRLLFYCCLCCCQSGDGYAER